MKNSFVPNWTKVRSILVFSMVSEYSDFIEVNGKTVLFLAQFSLEFRHNINLGEREKYICDGKEERCQSHEHLLCKILHNQKISVFIHNFCDLGVLIIRPGLTMHYVTEWSD